MTDQPDKLEEVENTTEVEDTTEDFVEGIASLINGDKTENTQEDGDDDEFSNVIKLDSMNRAELLDFVEAYAKKIGITTFVTKARDATTYEAKLLSSYVKGSEESERVLLFLEENGLDKDPLFQQRLFNDAGKVRVGDVTIWNQSKVYNEPLTGGKTLLAYTARTKGKVRKTDLAGSGITVAHRAPTISELTSFINNMAAEEIAYGRELGATYFSVADFINKRACIYFCLALIEDSSLKNWSDPNNVNLLKSIRLTDLGHILTQTAATMYPKGYPNFRLICPHCGDITEPVTIDISKFNRTRFAAMPEEAIKFLEKNRGVKNKVEFKDLEKYSESLGIDGETVTIGDNVYTLKVPTLEEYLVSGGTVVADIIKDIRGASDGSDTFAAVTSRALLTYLPWISKITVYTNEDDESLEPTPSFTASESSDIASILKIQCGDIDAETLLTESINKFIDKAQLTYCCYTPEPCRNCGEIPATKTGMVTLDPLSSFFTLIYWSVKHYYIRRTDALTSKSSKKN